MTKSVRKIVVTGGAGQIAYNLLFRIISGEMFGPDQPIALSILEVPEAFKVLEGVKMELDDCAAPLVREIRIGTAAMTMFQDAHYALLIGSKPRGPGMERADLLNDNGKIFIEQGRALNEVADRNVKVLVVGNPCNTNALIAMSNAPNIPRSNFHALTRLDQNRAKSLIAIKAKVSINDVTNVTIWGNHSSTQVPDFVNTKIKGTSLLNVIDDRHWLEGDFVGAVQKRGAAIIAARGKSSAASAANAVVDAIKALTTPTPEGEWFSTAVCSDENPYGITEDLIFSFPCRSKGDGSYEIVSDVPLDLFLKKKIRETEKELIEEKELVSSKLLSSRKKNL